MRARELAALITAALPHISNAAGQVAMDCPVVTVAEAVELVRMAALGRVAVRGGVVELDYPEENSAV